MRSLLTMAMMKVPQGGQRSVASPRREHDPITGLCNRSEPHSALYNSIRSACCPQLGPGTTTVTVSHNNVSQITTLGVHALFRDGLSVGRERHDGAGVSTSPRLMSLATKLFSATYVHEQAGEKLDQRQITDITGHCAELACLMFCMSTNPSA